MTYRKALINAALCGWKGDNPCTWPSPADLETILAWGASYCSQGTQEEDLRAAFKELVEEGLFFEIHPGLFEVPSYYCSYEIRFLSEITGNPNTFELWSDWVGEFDREHGRAWRKHGLCAGQGSQGPSDAPWGPCRGTKCFWYKDGKGRCNWNHKFAREN